MHYETASYQHIRTPAMKIWKHLLHLMVRIIHNDSWPSRVIWTGKPSLSFCKCAVQPEIVAVRKLICTEARPGLRWEFHLDTNVAEEIWLRCNEIYSKEWVYWCHWNPLLRCQIYQGCSLCSLARSPLTHHCCLLSSSFPFTSFFPFLSSISLSLPSSLPPSLCIWFAGCKKGCLSVSGTHCWRIEISDWEADVQAERGR